MPWWLAAAAIARDIMIGLGALIFRLWFGPLKGRPTVVSKINTLFQLGYLVAVMLVAAFGILPQDIVDALAYITFVTHHSVWRRLRVRLHPACVGSAAWAHPTGDLTCVSFPSEFASGTAQCSAPTCLRVTTRQFSISC